MIAYFDCFAGASGDMLLGSLLDAGLSLKELEADLARMDLKGYRLEADRVTRRGLSGTHLRVVADSVVWPARNLSAVETMIGSSTLPEPVKARSLSVFRQLAAVEAGIHGVPLSDIHFHELGAVDSLVDIVGFFCAMERLRVGAIYSSSLPQGGGTVQTQHGRLPVPAPATLALIAAAGAPTVPGPGQAELVTPTGAALLTQSATFEQPAMAIRRVGYGFGTKEFEWPNALRVWLGEPLSEPATSDADLVVELACNLDDVTGEALGYAMQQLFAAGALDVWFTPIQMKKNRPATLLSALARPADADRLVSVLLRETPTLGVRRQTLSRLKADRLVQSVETPWGEVRVKVKLLAGAAVSVSLEYDDCARLAAASGASLADVMDSARAHAAALLAR
ncbi:MAG: hypothetical protein BWY10_02345 [Chloroflexi bacterium ADurb.Bin180]|nr:MAG: hypothetical protein BWY10_02345 [Chloroflexi bacterium ADurb.Bin180]